MAMVRARALVEPSSKSWRWLPHASVWRGRDDPMGEVAPRMEDVVPVLFGPVDDRTPRVVPRRTVDEMINEHFAELNIDAIWDRIGPMRCQKYRYKKLHYTEIVYPPVYSMAFKDPKLPLIVDIGSGDGRILMLMAKRNPQMNYLGLEKRSKKVEISSRFAKELQLTNLHFVLCNATISFETLLATYPGPLTLVTIICPDPHLKMRFRRIRMVKRRLVNQILKCLGPGGKIFFQTEFEEVADYMRSYLDKHLGTYLSVVDEGNTAVYDEDGWLLMNPLQVRSETEIDLVAHGEKMYRRFYERLDKEFVLRIPFCLTKPQPNIPAPLDLPKKKKDISIYDLRFKPYGRRRVRNVKRLKAPADIILNGECYPPGYFKKLLSLPFLIKRKKRRRAVPRPRKALGVYEGP